MTNTPITLLSHTLLPGIKGETKWTPPEEGWPTEEARTRLYDEKDEYVGEVVYVRRSHERGSEYGWVLPQAPGMPLLHRIDAVKALLGQS